ncbi:VWA domain-containing protein [Paenalcaligenes niemegkensis]|uniref:VWA domain-containing protein n=1 Tax=Paenalcaligenes niemegkensis TaxID=2895469 RepID=UPI001EE947E5|nr:vWA domain-containing protein [Paenalcaligenes niemegkensis]MCQ9615837.1 VWA domain-containing protein [Paenalcaligenes niemegkensis]
MSSTSLHRLRRLLLLISLIGVAIALWQPTWQREQATYKLLFTVDITGSMNVRDYTDRGHPQSRLERSKQVMLELLQQLPCGSQVGLAIFTERRSFLLLENMEVCSNYSPLSQAISMLNWRMAWEGDSHIARGLYSAVDLAHSLNSDLLFISDGQEAPPLPHHGRPDYDGTSDEQSAPQGFVLGAGGLALSPIPKHDEEGNEIGFFSEDEVDQENRLGLPPTSAEESEGWHPRNAPFGAASARGTEHLSSVKQSYLQELALATNLDYADLDTADQLLPLFATHLRATLQSSPYNTRSIWLGITLLSLILYYLSALLTRREQRP